MDSSQQQSTHMLHTSPQVRPPISPSHYDYLPKRSAPASPPGNNNLLHGGTGPSTRAHNITGPAEISRPHPFGNTASPSYFNGNATTSPNQPSMSHNNSAETTPPAAVVPRKRAHVEDILNPVHEEVIVSKPPSTTNTSTSRLLYHNRSKTSSFKTINTSSSNANTQTNHPSLFRQCNNNLLINSLLLKINTNINSPNPTNQTT